MKKISFVVFICLLVAKTGAQTSLPNSAYGGVFTPKGHLHALVVLITFKDDEHFKNADNHLGDWDMSENGGLPKGANADDCSFSSHFFKNLDDFENNFEAVDYNFSKEWFWASGGQFYFTAELFADSTGRATTVEIDPKGTRNWSQTNLLALHKMKELNPKMDFKRFDRRANQPNFRFDNSDTTRYKPDKNLDYVIFIYRYGRGWKQQPVLGMNNWLGAGGGLSSISGVGIEQYNGYRMPDGFMMMLNSGVFLHEIAHTLYNAPHLMGGNGTVGDYFYCPSGGWGFTGGSLSFIKGMNAWERWYAGFIELTADLKIPKDTTFLLRDFLTTGDAARIKVPHTKDHYLWLEYHPGQHPLDVHPWRGNNIDDRQLPDMATGIYAYIERITDSRQNIINALSDKCNGLKLLNAAGNYDYAVLDSPAVTKNSWGNQIYAFRRGKTNALSGTNPWYLFRADFNKDNKIDLNTNTNSTGQENVFIASEEIDGQQTRTYTCFGVYDADKNRGYSRKTTFGKGDALSAISNPPFIGYPRYDHKKTEWEPLYLHDWQVEITDETEKAVKVAVKRQKLSIDGTFRLAAPKVVLAPDAQKEEPDLTVLGRLLVAKSGTVSRHTPDENGGFVHPTHWLIQKQAWLQIGSTGNKRGFCSIEDDSKVQVESTAKIELQPFTTLEIKDNAQLILGADVELILGKKAKIIVRKTALFDYSAAKITLSKGAKVLH